MLLYLFNDDVLFALKLVAIQGGIEEHVRKDIDRVGDMLGEYLGVIAGVLLVRERIEVAADRVELVGDLPRGSRRRPLEQHMFDDVCNPLLGRNFIARPDPDPYADGS